MHVNFLNMVDYLAAVTQCVSDFYILSVTGYNGGGNFMAAKTALFRANAQAWNNGDFEMAGYPGLRSPTNRRIGQGAVNPLISMQTLKTQYVQPDPIDLNACENGEIIDYLSRCRIARFGDCDVNAIEVALILSNHGFFDRDQIEIVTDQIWGHTYVRIQPHAAYYTLAGVCIVDPWANNVARNYFQRQQYRPAQANLADGTPTLTQMGAAETFIRTKHEFQANEVILGEMRALLAGLD